MQDPKEYWNGVFDMEWQKYQEDYMNKDVDYWNDKWLDKYEDLLEISKDVPIIDLGCGFGNDTNYLIDKGYEVISCDISEEALTHIKQLIPKVKTKVVDMLEGLPFDDNSTYAVISNLSMHYFNLEDTKKIINEIDRILKSKGVFICRVNSTSDKNYCQMDKIELGKNFYDCDNKFIRLFDREDIEMFFKHWEIIRMSEHDIIRYRNPKTLWEFCVQKY